MSNIIHITKADDLFIENNQLVIISWGSDEKANRISLENIMAVIIENCKCRITGILQVRLAEQNIPLIICNEKHQPILHSIGLYNHFQVSLRLKEQISWSDKKKEKLWGEIVKRKIENQRKLLEFTEKSILAINKLEIYENNVGEENCDFERQEAIAARVYFQELFGKDFKRFASDGINSALNYGYAILRALISSKLVAKGFHPSLGIHHKSQFNNYNFADDIIEIFRPMVDYIVYFNQQEKVNLSKEYRQEMLIVLTQDVFWKGKKYELSQVLDYFIDNIRNYFVENNSKIEIPELRIEAYEY